jgi:hypothetical protein
VKVQGISLAAAFPVFNANHRSAPVTARIADEANTAPAIDPNDIEIARTVGERLTALEATPNRRLSG